MALAVLLLLVPILLAACSDDDTDAAAGLTREEVQEIVKSEAAASAPAPAEPSLTRAELEEAIQAAIAAMPQPQPSLTSAEVEELIQAAIADLPKPDRGLTADEAVRLARYALATLSPKTSPAEYTKFFVNNAISRYEAEGREATLANYNQVESIDDQWYVFIVDEDGAVISHFNDHVLGENLNGPLGTDANGYTFGPEMLAGWTRNTRQSSWTMPLSLAAPPSTGPCPASGR